MDAKNSKKDGARDTQTSIMYVQGHVCAPEAVYGVGLHPQLYNHTDDDANYRCHCPPAGIDAYPLIEGHERAISHVIISKIHQRSK